jgi:hypothetical protein
MTTDQAAVDRAVEQLRAAGQHVALGEFTDPGGLAWLAGVSIRTVRRWRAEGIGPQPIEGHRTLYRVADAVQWVLSGSDPKNKRTFADTTGHHDVDAASKRRYRSSSR